MGNKWVYGHGIYWCPMCGVTVDPEQVHCLVCGYEGADDINVGHTGYDDHDCSGLLDE